MGINGVIIGLLISSTPSIAISLYVAWKKYGTKADILNSMRILLISAFAAVAGYFGLQAFPSAYWVELLVGVVIFFGVYIMCIPISGVVNQTDLNNLRTMFGATNSLSKIMNVPLTIIEKLLNSVSNIKQKGNHART